MGKALKRWFFNLSIRSKIVLLIYTIILVMFISLSLILLHIADNNAKKDLMTATSKSVLYSNLIVEKEQQYLYGIAAYYATSPEVQKMIHDSNTYGQTSGLSESLLNVIQSRQYVLSLAFYNKRGENINYITIDNSQGAVNQDPTDPSRPIYSLINDNLTFAWEYIAKGEHTYMEQDNSPKICLWHIIKDNSTWSPIGFMSITLDSRKLFPVDAVLDEIGEDIFILDQTNGKVFGRSKLINSFSSDDISSLISKIDPYIKTDSFFIQLLDTHYYASYAKIWDTSFVSFALEKSDNSSAHRETFALICLFGIILCIIALLPLLIFIASFLTKPLHQLQESMERFRAGDRDVRLAFKYHDEIGKLGDIIDTIAMENNQLLEQTYLLTIRSQAAELSKLQAQIDPHFIYNTLNIIQWTAIDHDDNEIAELAYSISMVFQLSLNNGKDIISIAEEREFLYYYLSLQERRFAGRISYTLYFDDDIMDVSLPKLMIQPLVENSCVHGMKDMDSHVDVVVRVTQRKQDRLHIVVTDNGIGIPPEILRLLPDRLPKGRRNVFDNHFALKNVAERLALYYDDDYVFDIKSDRGAGTEITIDIPFHHKNI